MSPSLTLSSRLLVVVGVFLLIMMLYVSKSTSFSRLLSEAHPSSLDHIESKEYYNVAAYVRGPPTNSLFDNLKNGTQYITAFLDAGWTNNFQSNVNMIYLGLLTGRVPVIPPNSPDHIDISAGLFPFGEIFDLARLSREIRHPVVEWRDLKSEDSEEVDHIGCWSQWATCEHNLSGGPRRSRSVFELRLDPSYVPVPDSTKILHGHNSFSHISRLAFREGREEGLRDKTPFPSVDDQQVIWPDERLLCFDFLYYLSSTDPFEWEKEWSPAWSFVGKHLHWRPRMAALAELYIKKALGVIEAVPMPKFISIHLRRDDFAPICLGNLDTCFPPISEVARLVNEVQTEILAKNGVSLLPGNVIVTSDETDPAWWSSVRAAGWKYVNHTQERTVEDLGLWYPLFIDTMIQSMGMGFIGTAHSTMSLVAGRRVQDWNGGVVKMAAFGPNAYPAN